MGTTTEVPGLNCSCSHAAKVDFPDPGAPAIPRMVRAPGTIRRRSASTAWVISGESMGKA
ncbi:hypothetical protein QFZ35_001191 [Arthrobacter ulcerisalmonis]|nr:hypothetical protein [Arthrobacter ulcerisalmonis]MDQ0662693.1 hypothetical protein [Arthrobacter ulcerisalmonis]